MLLGDKMAHGDIDESLEMFDKKLQWPLITGHDAAHKRHPHKHI